MPSADLVNATRTTTQLLDALRDLKNEPVWALFDARYRPVIQGLARRLGLDDEAAEETAQQTLSEFVRAYRDGRYDRERGRLSSWLLGIAHITALKALRSRRGHAGNTALDAVPDESSLRLIWTEERDRAILERALRVLRAESDTDERTILAFELVALRGVPASDAASQCGMSVEQVYVAKSRCTKRLRGLVEAMEVAFEEDA
ncbi:MAG TPA: sigma-70 family RNA polymerase sigma factor [Phycisphaerales bacterium]|nr:sigma-70 family RNA polymerase sigma factor [Phycisphaerales bacterium]